VGSRVHLWRRVRL